MKPKATVYSVYMDNIPSEVVQIQNEVVRRFLPRGWEFQQVLHCVRHGDALKSCIEKNLKDITVFLDIDCVPLNEIAFTYLLDNRWSVQGGALIGAAQRASHINNNNHIYAGPFCLALKNATYRELGSPSFNETDRGDVGEELTYVWQKAGKPTYFLYPSDVQHPLWTLIDRVSTFGLGTTYESLFYHAFCIRNCHQTEKMFIQKCKEILAIDDERIKEKESVTLS